MNITVSKSNYNECIEYIINEPVMSIDTETTGLLPMRKNGDRLFSIIITCPKKSFYLNYNRKADHLGGHLPNELVLDKKDIPLLTNCLKGKLIFFHNAIYDMSMLAKEGLNLLDFPCRIHCTQAIARVELNNRLKLNLDTLSKECLNQAKDDLPKKYCIANKLWEWEKIPGRKTRNKKYFYDKIPFDIIAPYGHQDGKLTLELGLWQIKRINQMQNMMPPGKPGPLQIMEQENSLIKIIFKQHWRGIRVNRKFVEEAYNHNIKLMNNIETEFCQMTGAKNISQDSQLVKVFKDRGIPISTTDNGNPSIDRNVLANINDPIAPMILDFRDAQKKSGTFFGSILYHLDENDFIHPTLKSFGTATGRKSAENPNLQQQTKVEPDDPRYNDLYLVRRSYIPSPGKILAMQDYDQMEYRLMLLYAKQMNIIEEIKAGKDVHQATGDWMGVPRKDAKTLNFMLLYGGGNAKLCLALFKPTMPEKHLKALERYHRWNKSDQWSKVSRFYSSEQVTYNRIELDKSFDLLKLYKEKMPNVINFTEKVISKASKRGFVFNWAGRIYYFDKRFSYKAPNYIIQGGCADIVKKAMLKIDPLFENTNSNMLMQVHDEIIYEIAEDELHLLKETKEIMENVYPSDVLKLTVGTDISRKSWQDKEELKFDAI